MDKNTCEIQEYSSFNNDDKYTIFQCILHSPYANKNTIFLHLDILKLMNNYIKHRILKLNRFYILI